MQALFQFNNLLNNEYLIRKFQVDPFNSNQLVLPYEVVQRENSIKLQYVQNDLNLRKQYHLILTKILQTHNGKLWNYDSSYLIIRPFFPRERKRLYFKVKQDLKAQVLQKIEDELKSEHKVAEFPYQADPSFVKIYVTAADEKTAKELFQKLKVNENIEQILMEDIDYLQEFQTSLQQKKMQRYLENQKMKQEQFPYQNENQLKSKFTHYQGQGQRYYDPQYQTQRHNDQRYYDNQGSHQYDNRQDDNQQQRPYDPQAKVFKSYRNTPKYQPQPHYQQAQYQQPQHQENSFQQQSNQQAPFQQPLGEQITYQLVRKNSLNKTPKQHFKSPQSFAKDYPALDEGKQ